MLNLTLYWQALSRPGEDYTFFVHVLDAAGQVLSQWDGQPDGGAYPTSIWDPGEVVLVPLQVPLPTGAQQVAIGVYGPPAGERLPVQGAAGDDTNRYFLDGLTLEDDE
jgi:hypothetical protein